MDYWENFIGSLQKNIPVNLEFSIGVSPKISYWKVIGRLLEILKKKYVLSTVFKITTYRCLELNKEAAQNNIN